MNKRHYDDLVHFVVDDSHNHEGRVDMEQPYDDLVPFVADDSHNHEGVLIWCSPMMT